MNPRGISAQRTGKVLVVNADSEVSRILEVNLKHADLEVVSAHNWEETVNRVNNDRLDLILLDPDLPDIDDAEIYRQLKKLPQVNYIPIILIGTSHKAKSRSARLENIADYYISKPFNTKDVVAVVQEYLTRKELAGNINPLTGLPNQAQINNEISRLIEKNTPFAAIYIAMADLRIFNKVYGYAQGDRVIHMLGDIVSEAIRLFGNPDDLVGHIGSDRFIAISTPGKARLISRRIIADYNRRIKSLYSDEHLQKGYIAWENPLGMEEQSPIMTLRVAVVTNQKRSFNHHIEVIEALTEQMDFLKLFPGDKSFYDLQGSSFDENLAVYYRGVPNVQREGVKAMHGVFKWLDFLIQEMNIPIMAMNDSLVALRRQNIENLSFEEQNSLQIIRENLSQLNRVANGILRLTRDEQLTADAVFEEVNITNTFNWIIEQLRGLLEKRNIRIDTSGIEDVGRVLVDRRDLTQSLLYILRGELQSCPPDSRIQILVTEKNIEHIGIQCINTSHYIPRHVLTMLLRGQREGAQNVALKNELYPAKMLLEGIGGELNVVSTKEKGTCYTLMVPRRWQSYLPESNGIRVAIDVSRKEARAELQNLERSIDSLAEQVPQEIKGSLEKLRNKVQELGVLCNRSLFLTDDLHSRLEIQQDRSQQHEAEQLAMPEAVLAVCREIASSMNIENLFDLKSARQVLRYSLAIAKEFRLSENDRQALHHAAILKDLALVSSPSEMLERKIVSNIEKAMEVKIRFNQLWRILSTVNFLSPSLIVIRYKWARYDGNDTAFDVKGDSIPLCSRILAVANNYNLLTSGQTPHGKLSPKLVIQKIVDESGQRFCPNVVSAFLTTIKKKELNNVSSES